jgi:hypothetical protein
MYAEFYNLKHNAGYTFRCKGVHIWRDQFRIRGPDEEWYYVSMMDDKFLFKDIQFTDFGASSKRWPKFKLLTFKEAKKWLEPQ